MGGWVHTVHTAFSREPVDSVPADGRVECWWQRGSGERGLLDSCPHQGFVLQIL